jgi:hypothetical protein
VNIRLEKCSVVELEFTMIELRIRAYINFAICGTSNVSKRFWDP